MIICAELLPLAVFTIIQRTSGFWGSIISYFLVGDKLNKVEILTLFVGFFGVYLMVSGKEQETTKKINLPYNESTSH
jgi:drug/metabolite transporter (DMT)-like permease